MVTNDFMGMDGFLWFVGVVEDRNDPELAGRVRVRCIGLHTEDKDSLPTEDLPWAQVLAPTDTPSMAGMGNTPPFLVEGTHVVGFFMDSTTKNQPIILGSIPGKPVEQVKSNKGFYDPKEIYPVSVHEPDTNRLIRGSICETHPSLIKRRGMHQEKVPKALKPYLTEVSINPVAEPGVLEKEKRLTWDEPPAKGDTLSKYPFNHAHESEGGHVHEIDDSPGGERLLQQHISGSFTEIHPNGTKVVKVVGDNYEIIVGGSNVLIEGDVNITYGTDKEPTTVRQLVKGDYILEVEGEMHTKVHKGHFTKIGARGAENGGGNKEEEIIGNHSFHVFQGVRGYVGAADKGFRDHDVVIGGSESRIVNGVYDMFIKGDMSFVTLQDAKMVAKANLGIELTDSGIMSIKSGGESYFRSKEKMTQHTEANLVETVGTTKESTTGGKWDHTSLKDITIIAGPNIYLNP